MDALKLAFDTIIVGVLALPWLARLALAIDLFLASKPGQAKQLVSLLQSGGSQVPAAAVGVVLFSMAYLLGAAVSRISGDFFNDDDLFLPITADGIRTAVYCAPAERTFLTGSFSDFGPHVGREFSAAACGKGADHAPVNELFDLQESALQQLGSDKTTVLNQLHSQISVLRGAALNGVIAFVLCLFGLGANRTGRRVPWWCAAGALFGVGTFALFRHWGRSDLNDPPIMEFTVIVLGVTSGFSLWAGAPPRRYGSWLLLSSLLTGIAFFAWWWTEILYDQLVLHSSFALVRHLAKP
jgi:hypothetical protein